MQERLNLDLRSKPGPDDVPDFVVGAAAKGIREALREIIHGRRVLNQSGKERSTNTEDHGD